MTLSTRRRFFLALAALLLTSLAPAQADEEMDAILKRGRLSFAVYNEFPPYSDNEKGLDVDIAKALAAKLGLKAEIIGFQGRRGNGRRPPQHGLERPLPARQPGRRDDARAG
jgi:ABC-type amino acid transport substrate-binding protein